MASMEEEFVALRAAWQELKRAAWNDRWDLGITLAFLYLGMFVLILLVGLVELP